MKLLITGATGLIGLSIVEQALNNKIEVHYLTTRKNKLDTIIGATGFLWNPSIQEIDNQCFEGVDTIIHLAGSSISKKWTSENKKEIIRSLSILDTVVNLSHKTSNINSKKSKRIYAKNKNYSESINPITDNFYGNNIGTSIVPITGGKAIRNLLNQIFY